MKVLRNETFGLMKTLLDAHTMGIHAAVALLKECEYRVEISPMEIEEALEKIELESSQQKILAWIKENNVRHIGISYRLDPDNAVEIVGRLVRLLKNNGFYESAEGIVKSIYFAGLKPACDRIEQEYSGRIRTFRGGESAEETLLVMGIPQEEIPKHIMDGCKYDKELMKFGKKIISDGKYRNLKPLERKYYPNYGTFRDNLIERLQNNFIDGFQPLIRAHSGPFSAEMTRLECLRQYNSWCRDLAKAGFLDILSIGSSQLSQSNFGEKWNDKINGGGVPVNSEEEYHNIWVAAKPMLVRTYSGTKNIRNMAEIYERTINISWHALSLWWFDELDGRGPNSLYDNLKEHISTIKYVASIGKPIETNVPHHFAFRGCDDVTYIVSAILAAKMVKKCGAHTFVFQNMLNTPRSTWGIQDLAKSRAILNMLNDLRDEEFRVIVQTRAGLDFFKPDLQEAKAQLAAVTALMDDIDPNNTYCPEIIHVVSYCEALFLATPEIINDSIKITRASLKEYRELKKQKMTPNVMTDDIYLRTTRLETEARRVLQAMEKSIPDLYSPEGLYLAFVAGWLPVPELWSQSSEFVHARSWETQMKGGGVCLFNHEIQVPIESRINKCISNMVEAEYILRHKYK